MPRFLKQFLYGIFYLAIIGGVGYGAYARDIKPAPSCFDMVQNQGEQGVDCGGPCAQLCTAAVQPIASFSEPRLIPGTPGNATIFAKIENANTDFGAESFPYAFTFYDASGTALQSLPGTAFIYPGQTKYLTAVNVPVPPAAASVGFSAPTGTVDWITSSTMGMPPDFAFQNIVTAPAASGTVAAGGLLVNGEGAAFTNIEVVALFEDSAGYVVGISETEIDAIPANGSVPVSVSYLADPRIDPARTEMYGYALR